MRIALNLKGLSYEYVAVHLARREQHDPAYRSVSPDSLVPGLDVAGDPDHALLIQSTAIIEYLDETHPKPPLLPRDPPGRARVRALAQTIACEIHPISNLRVLKYLADPRGLDDGRRAEWYNHWVREGLRHYERRLQLLAEERARAGLPPSVYSPMVTRLHWLTAAWFPSWSTASAYDDLNIPLTLAIFERCRALDAFQRAHPSRCPDAE